MCAIQQGRANPIIRTSPDIRPNVAKKQGLGLGFDNLLSIWASDNELVSIATSHRDRKTSPGRLEAG